MVTDNNYWLTQEDMWKNEGILIPCATAVYQLVLHYPNQGPRCVSHGGLHVV